MGTRGGFVGGDKSDITGYAVELAARGYTVININYALAPKRKYPTPVLQLGEAYEYIKENAKKYNVKLDDLYFAGDSAGAQISGQFVTIQTSPDYAKLTGIEAIVAPSTIKGILLFCGPYNMPALAKMETSKEVQDFMRTTGWAYFGKRSLKHYLKWKSPLSINTLQKITHQRSSQMGILHHLKSKVKR